MSQYQLTEKELNTFSRYLWEYGDKRKSDAFRATFPKTTAGKASIAVKSNHIFKREQVNIELIIARLHKQSVIETEEAGCGLLERKLLYAGMIALARKALLSNKPESAGNISVARNGLAACDQLNKLDGSYAPAKIEDVTAGKIELTRVVEYVTVVEQE